jgi:hypothetical protein
MEAMFGMFMGFVGMLLVFGIPLLSIWTGHRRKMAEMQIEATAEKAAQYVASNKDLENRVRVLERIVTDGGYDVATQIEALRDQRRVEGQLEHQREPSRN